MTTKKKGAPLRFPEPTGDPARDRLINLRRRLGLSQTALAEKLGVSQKTVAAWESGYNPSPSGPALKLLEMLEKNRGSIRA